MAMFFEGRRRTLAALTLLACAACDPVAARRGGDPDTTISPAPRAVALTFDDLPAVSTRSDTAVHAAILRDLAERLRARGVSAIGFVNERGLHGEDGETDPGRVAWLRAWLDAGHDLGNHTFSHPSLFSTPLPDFRAEVLRGEEVTRALLAERGARPEWFRHPFLNTGPDSTTRAAFEAFLDAHGYRVAPVTIDNYDYMFARAYDQAIDRGDAEAARSVVDSYLPYLDTVFGYYEQQSRMLLDREPPQILLLHANRLNADNIDALLDMIERRGYRTVTLGEAMRDSVYLRRDGFIGRAGITWLHRWAITEGRPREFFRGEPDVPDFIRSAFEGGD